MPAPLKASASRAWVGVLLLTEAKMAAAASELLTGWCLFGLALLVSGGSAAAGAQPARAAPIATHPFPAASPGPAGWPALLLLLPRPLAAPALGFPPGLLARPVPPPACPGSRRFPTAPAGAAAVVPKGPEGPRAEGAGLPALPDGACLPCTPFPV